MDWFSALEGKKTYIVAFIAAGVGLLGAFGVTIPDWANYILAALGASTLRAAVSNEK